MNAWFISDIHLKGLNERNGNILLRFLFAVRDGKIPATHLFMLGDIFDFWVGDHDYFAKRYAPLIEALRAIHAHGTKIVYVEGNHDVHVKEFWQSLGFEAFVEDRYFDLSPWTVRVSHGDLMNTEDEAYARYRSVLRHGFMEKLAHQLPAKLLNEFGEWASSQSRKKSFDKRNDTEAELIQMIHKYAETTNKERPFDFIISGHMHFRDEWSFQDPKSGKKVTSINLGSWFQKPMALGLDNTGYNWRDLTKI